MRFSRKRSIKVIFRVYDCPPKCHMPQKVSQRGVPDILHISNILPAVESQSPCCYAPAACRLCFCSSMESGATPPPAKRLRGPPVDYTEDSNLAPVQEDAPLSPRTTGREITTMVAAPVTTMVAVPVQEPVQASAETVAPDRARLPVDTFAGRNDPCFLYLEQLPPQHHLVAGNPNPKAAPTHMCIGKLANGKTCMTPIKLVKKTKGRGFRPWLGTQHMQSNKHRNSEAWKATQDATPETPDIGTTFRLLGNQRLLSGPGSKAEQLAAQARWLMFGKLAATATAFENEYFRQMIRAQNPAAFFLNRRALLQHVEHEWSVLLLFMQHANKCAFIAAQGSPYAQGQHDATTLKINHNRYEGGSVTVAFDWICFTLAFVFERAPSGVSEDVASSYKEHFKTRIGVHPDAALQGCVQDVAARKTGKVILDLNTPSLPIDHEDEQELLTGPLMDTRRQSGINEDCLMHVSDKVMAMMLGQLFRSRNCRRVDPFNDGEALVKTHHNRAVELSYGERVSHMMELCESRGLKGLKPRVNHSTTRISSTFLMLSRQIQIWAGNDEYIRLKIVELQQCPTKNHRATKDEVKRYKAMVLSPLEWQATVEMEAAARYLRMQSVIAQKDSTFTGGYHAYVCRTTSQYLKDGAGVHVIDLSQLQKQSEKRMPRIFIPESKLTPIGRRCKQIGFAENNRRCATALSAKQLAAAPLDLRIASLPHFSAEEKAASKIALCAAYRKFAHISDDFKARMVAAPAAAAALGAAAWASRCAAAADQAATDILSSVPAELPASESDTEAVNEDRALMSCMDDGGESDDTTDDFHEFVLPLTEHSNHYDSDTDSFDDGDIDQDGIWVSKLPRLDSAIDDEFHAAYSKWTSMKVDWVGLYPEDLAGAVDTVHPLHDLFDLDLGVLLKNIEEKEASRAARGRARRYGHLTAMATCLLSVRMSSAFSERLNSAAKLVMSNGRTTLSDHMIEMLACLRMNRKFIEHMYANHAYLLPPPVTATIVIVEPVDVPNN